MLCFGVCKRRLRQVFPPASLHGLHLGGKGLCVYGSCDGVGNTEYKAGFHPGKLSGSSPDCASTQTSEVGMQHSSVLCKERSDVTRHHRIRQLRDLNLDFLSCPGLLLTPARIQSYVYY